MAGNNATRQTPGVREQWAVRALFFVGGFVGAGLFGLWVGTVGLTPLASTVIAAAIIAGVMLVMRLTGDAIVSRLGQRAVVLGGTLCTMLGYLGVLMGPAAIGFLAHAIGIADAFLFLALLVAVEMGIAAYVFRSVKA